MANFYIPLVASPPVGGSGGGGGSTGLVFPTFTNNAGTWTCDMTFEEVLAAANNHTCVGAFSQGGEYYPLGNVVTTEGHEAVYFGTIYIDTDPYENPVVYNDWLYINADGAAGYTYQYPPENNGGLDT